MKTKNHETGNITWSSPAAVLGNIRESKDKTLLDLPACTVEIKPKLTQPEKSRLAILLWGEPVNPEPVHAALDNLN